MSSGSKDWDLKMADYNRPEPEMETYKPYKRPTEYWCNDDEQVRIIEAALDLYEKSLAAPESPTGDVEHGETNSQ